MWRRPFLESYLVDGKGKLYRRGRGRCTPRWQAGSSGQYGRFLKQVRARLAYRHVLWPSQSQSISPAYDLFFSPAFRASLPSRCDLSVGSLC